MLAPVPAGGNEAELPASLQRPPKPGRRSQTCATLRRRPSVMPWRPSAEPVPLPNEGRVQRITRHRYQTRGGGQGGGAALHVPSFALVRRPSDRSYDEAAVERARHRRCPDTRCLQGANERGRATDDGACGSVPIRRAGRRAAASGPRDEPRFKSVPHQRMRPGNGCRRSGSRRGVAAYPAGSGVRLSAARLQRPGAWGNGYGCDPVASPANSWPICAAGRSD